MRLQAVRLETIHPLLVHFTIGTIPVLLIAYLLAWRRRSRPWAFTGDAVLVVTAILTVASLSFGLVSNALVTWPGGLGRYRLLHLILGTLATVMFVGLATFRLWQRQKSPVSGFGVLAASALVALVTAGTGWIGGEVLVFHSGMAVHGGAGGALAPPVPGAHTPRTLHEGMGQVRSLWAAADAELATMLVDRPTNPRFDAIVSSAAALSRLTSELPATLQQKGQALAPGLQSGLQAVAADASRLQMAARQHQPVACVQAMGRLTATCMGCHQTYRWSPQHPTALVPAR
jgi:uncharacterized membrane protein